MRCWLTVYPGYRFLRERNDSFLRLHGRCRRGRSSRGRSEWRWDVILARPAELSFWRTSDAHARLSATALGVRLAALSEHDIWRELALAERCHWHSWWKSSTHGGECERRVSSVHRSPGGTWWLEKRGLHRGLQCGLRVERRGWMKALLDRGWK